MEEESGHMKKKFQSLPRAPKPPASLQGRLCREGVAGTQLEQASHARTRVKGPDLMLQASEGPLTFRPGPECP